MKKESGDDGTMDTPVPIPNIEVKHCCGEGSLGKNSKLLGSFFAEIEELLHKNVEFYQNIKQENKL